jgi:hypothetical protein
VAVLWTKDTATKLETLRSYLSTDRVYHAIDNRPLYDLEQRDLDLNRALTPARGLRVRESDPVTSTIDIESGYYIGTDGRTITQFAGINGVVIGATANANYFRYDLVYFNLRTNVYGIVSSGETVGSYPGSYPQLPSHDGIIPLAILYVDNTLPGFSEQTAEGSDGCIIDVRPATGVGKWIFEDVTGNVQEDLNVPSVGTSYKAIRSNHVHPRHASAGDTPSQEKLDLAASGGTEAYNYSLVDHVHDIDTTADDTLVLEDNTPGVPGDSEFPTREDHVHGLNFHPTLLIPSVVKGVGAAGNSGNYIRHDHIHEYPYGFTLWGERCEHYPGTTWNQNSTYAIDFPAGIVVPAG